MKMYYGQCQMEKEIYLQEDKEIEHTYIFTFSLWWVSHASYHAELNNYIKKALNNWWWILQYTFKHCFAFLNESILFPQEI